MRELLMLIDDHALFRSGVAMLLMTNLADMDQFEAGSVEQALDCPLVPSLVLLDIHLQGFNGLYGIPLLKRKWPHVKIVVLSADDASVMELQAKRQGANAFVSKSEPPEHMLETILRVLRGDAFSFGEVKTVKTATPVLQTELTPRQRQVLALLCEGLSNKRIGQELNLSENTVRGHVQGTLAALQVSSRSQAAFMARRLGLVK